ncbi:MAG: hypothetical protein ACO3Q1_05275, partial [Candidatus Nanopelagicales bacterium]
MSGRRLLKYLTSFLAFFAVLLSGIVAPVWFVPISKASAETVSNGNCVETVTSSTNVTVVESSNKCYIAFKNTGSNSWTPRTGITSVEVLLVAGGGGGGGSSWSGGGGAGGVVYDSDFS